jgi:hypothetical protein
VDTPALNVMLYRQPTPFPDEDSDCRAGNDLNDGLPFGQESELQEDALLGTEAGAASGMVDGDIWTPLASWVGVSGSSISSRENKILEDHIAEPLVSQVDTSGLSSESTAPGLNFKRPTLYILRCQKRKEGDLEAKFEQHGVKRPLSDENRSSSGEEASGRHGADVRPPPDNDSSESEELIPWSKGPDPRGRNGDGSNDDYKEDPVDL